VPSPLLSVPWTGSQAAVSTLHCVEQIPVGQMSVDQMVFGQKTWNGGDIVTLGRFCFCLLCSTKKLKKCSNYCRITGE